MFLLDPQLKDFDLQYVKGIGPHNKKLLRRKNIESVKELLTFFPRDYEDRREVVHIGQLNTGEYTIKARIIEIIAHRTRGPLRIDVIVGDDTGRMPLVFFNQKYITKVLKNDDELLISGKVEFNYGRLFFNNPDWEKVGSESSINHGRIVPVYPLTEGMSQNRMRNIVYNCLTFAKDKLMDPIPEKIREEFGLPRINYALIRMHFPKHDEEFSMVSAFSTAYQRRLILDEVFLLQYFWGRKKLAVKRKKGIAFKIDASALDKIYANLPWELTDAQANALKEILADMEKKEPMNRLLQGDVGSGKTVVSLIAMINAVANGYQCAMMVPTEVLAQQHYVKILNFIRGLGINLGLIYSKMKKKEYNETTRKIAEGEFDIIVGTHALFQSNIEFKKLGFVVIDEQHRFGVEQRMEMIGKGVRPDVLVMSATPIPRSLALTLYGDMDFSIIDKLPGGRKKIKTLTIFRDQDALLSLIKEHIGRGEKVFVVFPLIEETEKVDLLSAQNGYDALVELFGEKCVGLLHGRMKSSEKIDIMDSFAYGDLSVLVSTTVIEVGIDVPEASLMVVMNAERFGLSQLHQLRGRVGRGAAASKCVLYTEVPINERLNVMVKYSDGFDISQKDFKLRGPGEIMGTAQSGVPPFKLFNVFRDRQLVETARKMISSIRKIYDEDAEELKDLNRLVKEYYEQKMKYSEIL
ncbi:ATP-dependent DNA helicase RecG [bacterium]|nr:ATP-dependent DNA helicase RecG [bacterium]